MLERRLLLAGYGRQRQARCHHLMGKQKQQSLRVTAHDPGHPSVDPKARFAPAARRLRQWVFERLQAARPRFCYRDPVPGDARDVETHASITGIARAPR